ncbi:MAG: Tol-Pal system beta propeller repeat protein TolB [Vicinamibacterales bacterium]
MPRLPLALSAAVAAVAVAVSAQAPATPASQQPQPQQPSAVGLTITSDVGATPQIAVPDFMAPGGDKETVEMARVLAQVLFDDLSFEREYDLVPRDTYASIPPARSFAEAPFDRWRELGADALVLGSLTRSGTSLKVEMRLFDVRSRQQVLGREYSGSAGNPRLYAHTMADEIHQTQSQLRGVARTKLTFSSDRVGGRAENTVQDRNVKEIFISDYDGANQRRVTVNRQLNVFPSWSPDGRAIAYTSYRRGYPDIFISLIYQGTMETPTNGQGQNWLPVFSPDGTRIAFTSNRDGNSEIYVMNRDGSAVRRLTNHPAIDVTPTWSPSGAQIAFTSDRTGTPQIWVISADGLNLRKLTSESYADRPTWSPAPYNEIAYAARTSAYYDIKIFEVTTGNTRQITFGQGTNESPAWAPNGRHLAFMSTRAGRASQIFTVGRDGKDVRQVTREGNNFTPNWSQ